MPLIARDPELPSRPTRVPEVVTPPPAVPTVAIERFRQDPAALKAAALSLLDRKVKPVETLAEANVLADHLAQAKTLLKNIEARRKLIVEPIKREAADVDKEARTWSEPIQKHIQDLERVLIAFQRKQAAEATRQEEARQQAIRDAAKQQAQATIMQQPEAVAAAETAIMHLEATAPAEPVRGFKTDSGTTSLRTRWRIEVVNAAEVPDAYLVPDLKRLQAVVDAHPNPEELHIDGCHIEPVDSLTTRTR